MALVQYDLVTSTNSDAGGNPHGIETAWVKSAGASIGATSEIRVTIDTANMITNNGQFFDGRTEIMKALELFEAFILKDTWPPT